MQVGRTTEGGRQEWELCRPESPSVDVSYHRRSCVLLIGTLFHEILTLHHFAMHDALDIAGIVGGSRRERDWTDLIAAYERTGAARVVKFWQK